MAKSLPDTTEKARDPLEKQRQKVSFQAFRAAFQSVDRCHNYVTNYLRAKIPNQPDTTAGWRALYDAAIAAEAAHPPDPRAPVHRPLAISAEYERELMAIVEEDEHHSLGGTDKYMGAS